MKSSGKGEIFNGPASAMRESDWLSVEDVQSVDGEAIDLEVVKVLKHKKVQFAQGRSKDVCYSLAFKGAKRQLLLNKTNRDRMIGLFGTKTAAWPGNRIRLHLEPDKLPTGGRGPCTRIIAAPPSTSPTQKTTEQLEAEAADRAAEQR